MGEPIRYEVDLTDRVHHLVRVTATVPADLASGGRVVLPVWTPGSYVVRDYVRHVQWVRARTVDGREVALVPDGRSAWRLPDDTGGVPVEVELELYANDLSVRTNHVDDHHALLTPAATFPYVEGGEDRPHEVRLPAQPSGHRVWSLLPAGPDPDVYVADDRDHLIDSAFEVGDLPSVDFEVAGVPHTFVWAGHGGSPDLDRVAADATAIGEATVALFDGEVPANRYTFLCAGWDAGGGGLEHRDGSVLQVPVHTFHDPDRYARFQSLVAHEYLHLWNVKRLVPAALVRPDYDRPTHSESLWVAEGWTAYYDDLLPARANVWSLRRFLDALRDTWRQVLDTPGALLQPLRRASYEAWTKHYVRDEHSVNATTDYYAHGALVAWYLDLRLRAGAPDGDGLDDVLRLLWERHAGGGSGYTEDDVAAALSEVAGEDLHGLLDRLVGGSELPPVDEIVASVGLAVELDDDAKTPPDLGVVLGEPEGPSPVFASVLRDRPAWRAGITGGDRLLAVDGTTVGPTELDAALGAHAPGDTIEVTVRRGPRILALPVMLGDPRPPTRLVADDDADVPQREAFRRWTGRDLDDL